MIKNYTNYVTLKGKLPLVGADTIMSYPSRTYKIKPLFRMIYQSCFDVVNNDKKPLTRALLENHIGKEENDKIQLYDFNKLFEVMINNFKNEVHKSSYEEVAIKIRTHSNYLLLKEFYPSKELLDNLVIISFRIPTTVVKDVADLKRKTLGEVVELAISLYVTTCSETTFNLIYLSFQNYEDRK